MSADSVNNPGRLIPRPFIIIFQGRSGSTYLVDTLAKYSEICVEYEAFANMKSKGKSGLEQINWARQFWIGEYNRGAKFSAIGFKTKLEDVLDLDGFKGIIEELQIGVINLYRRNIVKQAVSLHRSLILSKRIGSWNMYSDLNKVEAIKIEKHELDGHVQVLKEGRADQEKFMSNLSADVLTVTYEDLFDNNSLAFGRILKFIGVADRQLLGNTMKHTSDKLDDVILNYESLRAEYSDTPLYRYFK